MRSWLLIACLGAACCAAFAADHVTLTGKVTDGLGKPLENATVMVYHAGVKKGYSTYCPSCYVDCGKRTATGYGGAFTIRGLNPELKFELLVVRDGYTPRFVKGVDPSQGPAETVALAPREPVDDPGRVVRGRIVDAEGQPLSAAVVMPLGISAVPDAPLETSGGRHVRIEGPVTTYGGIEGLEPIAVTNANGEFELAYRKKATAMLLQVEARGKAPKLIAVTTGGERKTIAVYDGAVIRGRLVNHGKPVADAEMGLVAQNRGGFGGNLAIKGDPYDEIRIGTRKDGTFSMTNVPAQVDWYIYGKMQSIAPLGVAGPVKCATRRDGEVVNVGDIEIQPGYRLRGKVTLSDGAVMAEGMRITVSAGQTLDSQTVGIGRDGRFEFVGLKGKYSIFASVRGYQPQKNRADIEPVMDRDTDDFAITLDPVAH